MRAAAREVLRELLPEVLGELRAPAPANGNGNGHRPAPAAVPRVPAPPVAAVLRPSTWSAPAAPGEVIGDGQAPAPVAEPVSIGTDEDLQRFVAMLAQRCEDPQWRHALASGQTRFTLARAGGRAGAGPASPAGADAAAVHIAKGAVTERIVREAARTGARLVLARRAVLTPLARDQARALGVAIEREAT